MAKTESTAVNELIEMVASGHSGLAEPGEELFSSSPKPMTAARMTAPLPIVRDAVPPLPRTRAPSGTQSNAVPAVRTSIAPPSRGSTIPPLPPTKQPTQRMAALPPPPGGFRTTQSRPSLPPPMRHSQQRPAEGTPAPELFSRTKSPTPAPASMPIAAPFEPRPIDDHPFAAQPAPAVEHQKIDDSWFQSSYLVDKVELTPTPKSGTYQVPRGANTIALIKKLVVPTGILVLLGVCIGGYLAFNGEGGHPRTQVATAPAAAPSEVKSDNAAKPAETPKADEVKTDVAAKAEVAAPKADSDATKTDVKADVAAKPEAPAAKPDAKVASAAPAMTDTNGMTTIKTSRGEVKLVDILIDSKPSGATVMLVDRGKTSFLGNTPVSAAVDPSRAYDVVLTAANHSPQVEHLDPNVTHHLAIMLGKPGNQAVAETHHHHHPAPVAVAALEPKAEVKVVAPAARPEAKEVAKVEKPAPVKTEKVAAVKTDKVAAPALAAAPAGTGTLMVSSKPPCEIVIDGKPPGLTTPQRSIPLPPGAHKVTFVNAGESINKTVSVVINADKPTKLIQDLMKK